MAAHTGGPVDKPLLDRITRTVPKHVIGRSTNHYPAPSAMSRSKTRMRARSRPGKMVGNARSRHPSPAEARHGQRS